MEESEILGNIMSFVNEAVIIGGYGYDYKTAIRMLYNGANLEDVLKWYNDRISN